MSKKIQKKADVAGLFYPSTKKELSQMLEYFMDQAKDINLSALGLIVPHAGYIYSGQIAAAAYKILAKQKNNYRQWVQQIRDIFVPVQDDLEKDLLIPPDHSAGRIVGLPVSFSCGVTYSDQTSRLPLSGIENQSAVVVF
mgnify:CR=1 FL=1